MKSAARVRRLVVIATIPLLSCCGWSDEEEAEPAPPASAPKLVGRIASVHGEQGFVLVEGYGRFGLGEGLLLSSVGGDGRTASLMASGERLGRFSAADLKSGEVRVGDLVYSRPIGGDNGTESPASGGGASVSEIPVIPPSP